MSCAGISIFSWRGLTICALASAMAAIVCSCEKTDGTEQQASSAPAVEVRSPVLWKHIQEATVVAVNDQQVAAELAQATAEALRTLNDARTRWAISKPAEKSLWAVKWAAPLAVDLNPSSSADEASRAGETTENIWVQPINWSPFRIEGVLLSSPIAPLECGRGRGEIVSFPVEELSDWMHVASDAPGAAFEGGYTVKVLEAKYGKDG